MARLCAYKDALGQKRQGFHALRIPWVDLALLDVVGTVLIAFAIAKWWSLSFAWTTLALFALGIVMHWVFCVDTTLNRFIMSPI